MYKMRLCVFTVRILYTQIMYSNVCVRLQKRFRFEWTRTVFFPRYGKIKKKPYNNGRFIPVAAARIHT